MDYRLHRPNLAMPGKQRQARTDHWFSSQLTILLGQVAAGPEAASSGDNHGGDRGAHCSFPAGFTMRALPLPRSPVGQKDFHRYGLCCDAALARWHLMAKLYAEFQWPKM
jgi:hypothetical protein